MENTEIKDVAEITIGRSNIYGFLVLVYRKELTKDLLQHIKDPQFLKVTL